MRRKISPYATSVCLHVPFVVVGCYRIVVCRLGVCMCPNIVYRICFGISSFSAQRVKRLATQRKVIAMNTQILAHVYLLFFSKRSRALQHEIRGKCRDVYCSAVARENGCIRPLPPGGASTMMPAGRSADNPTPRPTEHPEGVDIHPQRAQGRSLDRGIEDVGPASDHLGGETLTRVSLSTDKYLQREHRAPPLSPPTSRAVAVAPEPASPHLNRSLERAVKVVHSTPALLRSLDDRVGRRGGAAIVGRRGRTTS